MRDLQDRLVLLLELRQVDGHQRQVARCDTPLRRELITHGQLATVNVEKQSVLMTMVFRAASTLGRLLDAVQDLAAASL